MQVPKTTIRTAFEAFHNTAKVAGNGGGDVGQPAASQGGALLVWAGRVLRSNPTVVQRFAEYVRRECDVTEQVPLLKYEAAAIEWLLLIPPTTKQRGK